MLNRALQISILGVSSIFALSGCGVSKSKYQALETDLRESQARVVYLESQLNERRTDIQALRDQGQTQEKLLGALSEEIKAGNVRISKLKNRLQVDMVDKVLFHSGRASITNEGKLALQKVADVLKDTGDKAISVAGHTDNIPIGSRLESEFPTNWELSAARATSVVRYLGEVGVPEEKMSAIGFSQYHPVATNETPSGRQQNRRIEIVLLPNSMAVERSQELISEIDQILSNREKTAQDLAPAPK